MTRHPPRSTLVPYTTLFRAAGAADAFVETEIRADPLDREDAEAGEQQEADHAGDDETPGVPRSRDDAVRAHPTPHLGVVETILRVLLRCIAPGRFVAGWLTHADPLGVL